MFDLFYSPGLSLQDAIHSVAGGIVKVDINRAKPVETLVPGRHLHPFQPASVVASVSESQPQVLPDLESVAASELPPPDKLPVVVLVVQNIRPTAPRPCVHPGAELDRKLASGAEKAEETAAVHARPRDGAGEGGDARDVEGK